MFHVVEFFLVFYNFFSQRSESGIVYCGNVESHIPVILSHFSKDHVLKIHTDVNAVSKKKSTALHIAAKKGHVDVVKVLLENGARV